MRVLGFTQFGGPEVLRVLTMETPAPNAGEIRIAVHAAPVSPPDTAFRAGAGLARLLGEDLRPPFVPGMDSAGVVDMVGDGADSRFAVGDSVVGIAQPWTRLGGAYAEQIVVRADSVVHAPRDVDFAAASTLLVNAVAATLALESLRLTAGDTVAISGAAGSVGGFAVQLAREAGVQVIGDASPEDEALVSSLGADAVVPRGDGFVGAVRAWRPGGVDGLIDTAGYGLSAVGTVRDRGGLASLRPLDGQADREITVHSVNSLGALTNTALLEDLVRKVEDGVLTLRVSRVLPAEDAGEAHRRVEAGGLRGRLVLDFSPGRTLANDVAATGRTRDVSGLSR